MSEQPKIDYGGPAFPVNEEMDEGLGNGTAGMSLRDYFAAAALTGMAADALEADLDEAHANPLCQQAIADGDDHWNIVAESAYALADALLAARKDKP
jgi:hypothetical protein